MTEKRIMMLDWDSLHQIWSPTKIAIATGYQNEWLLEFVATNMTGSYQNWHFDDLNDREWYHDATLGLTIINWSPTKLGHQNK